MERSVIFVCKCVFSILNRCISRWKGADEPISTYTLYVQCTSPHVHIRSEVYVPAVQDALPSTHLLPPEDSPVASAHSPSASRWLCQHPMQVSKDHGKVRIWQRVIASLCCPILHHLGLHCWWLVTPSQTPAIVCHTDTRG